MCCLLPLLCFPQLPFTTGVKSFADCLDKVVQLHTKQPFPPFLFLLFYNPPFPFFSPSLLPPTGILWNAALSRVPSGQLVGPELCQWYVVAAQEKLSGRGRRTRRLFWISRRGFLHWESSMVRVSLLYFRVGAPALNCSLKRSIID